MEKKLFFAKFVCLLTSVFLLCLLLATVFNEAALDDTANADDESWYITDFYPVFKYDTSIYDGNSNEQILGEAKSTKYNVGISDTQYLAMQFRGLRDNYITALQVNCRKLDTGTGTYTETSFDALINANQDGVSVSYYKYVDSDNEYVLIEGAPTYAGYYKAVITLSDSQPIKDVQGTATRGIYAFLDKEGAPVSEFSYYMEIAPSAYCLVEFSFDGAVKDTLERNGVVDDIYYYEYDGQPHSPGFVIKDDSRFVQNNKSGYTLTYKRYDRQTNGTYTQTNNASYSSAPKDPSYTGETLTEIWQMVLEADDWLDPNSHMGYSAYFAIISPNDSDIYEAKWDNNNNKFSYTGLPVDITQSLKLNKLKETQQETIDHIPGIEVAYYNVDDAGNKTNRTLSAPAAIGKYAVELRLSKTDSAGVQKFYTIDKEFVIEVSEVEDSKIVTVEYADSYYYTSREIIPDVVYYNYQGARLVVNDDEIVITYYDSDKHPLASAPSEVGDYYFKLSFVAGVTSHKFRSDVYYDYSIYKRKLDILSKIDANADKMKAESKVYDGNTDALFSVYCTDELSGVDKYTFGSNIVRNSTNLKAFDYVSKMLLGDDVSQSHDVYIVSISAVFADANVLKIKSGESHVVSTIPVTVSFVLGGQDVDKYNVPEDHTVVVKDLFAACINPRKLYVKADSYTVKYDLWKDPNYSADVKNLNVSLYGDQALSELCPVSDGVYVVRADGEMTETVELADRIHYYSTTNPDKQYTQSGFSGVGNYVLDYTHLSVSKVTYREDADSAPINKTVDNYELVVPVAGGTLVIERSEIAISLSSTNIGHVYGESAVDLDALTVYSRNVYSDDYIGITFKPVNMTVIGEQKIDIQQISITTTQYDTVDIAVRDDAEGTRFHSANYTFTFPVYSYTISKRTLNVSEIATASYYGDAIEDNVLFSKTTITGFADGDHYSDAHISLSGVNVGEHDIVLSFAVVNADGVDLTGNYTVAGALSATQSAITVKIGKHTIVKRILTLGIDPAAVLYKYYGDSEEQTGFKGMIMPYEQASLYDSYFLTLINANVLSGVVDSGKLTDSSQYGLAQGDSATVLLSRDAGENAGKYAVAGSIDKIALKVTNASGADVTSNYSYYFRGNDPKASLGGAVYFEIKKVDILVTIEDIVIEYYDYETSGYLLTEASLNAAVTYVYNKDAFKNGENESVISSRERPAIIWNINDLSDPDNHGEAQKIQMRGNSSTNYNLVVDSANPPTITVYFMQRELAETTAITQDMKGYINTYVYEGIEKFYTTVAVYNLMTKTYAAGSTMGQMTDVPLEAEITIPDDVVKTLKSGLLLYRVVTEKNSKGETVIKDKVLVADATQVGHTIKFRVEEGFSDGLYILVEQNDVLKRVLILSGIILVMIIIIVVLIIIMAKTRKAAKKVKRSRASTADMTAEFEQLGNEVAGDAAAENTLDNDGGGDSADAGDEVTPDRDAESTQAETHEDTSAEEQPEDTATIPDEPADLVGDADSGVIADAESAPQTDVSAPAEGDGLLDFSDEQLSSDDLTSIFGGDEDAATHDDASDQTQPETESTDTSRSGDIPEDLLDILGEDEPETPVQEPENVAQEPQPEAEDGAETIEEPDVADAVDEVTTDDRTADETENAEDAAVDSAEPQETVVEAPVTVDTVPQSEQDNAASVAPSEDEPVEEEPVEEVPDEDDVETDERYLNVKVPNMSSEGKAKLLNNKKVIVDKRTTILPVTFENRMLLAAPATKLLYGDMKNAIMAYSGVKARSTNDFDTLKSGDKVLCRFGFRDDVLYVYLPLTVADMQTADVRYLDCSNETKCKDTPIAISIKSSTKMRKALRLIELIAQAMGLQQDADYAPVDYLKQYPYLKNAVLYSRDLVFRGK